MESLSRGQGGNWKVSAVDKVEAGKSRPLTKWKLESIGRGQGGNWKDWAVDKVEAGKSQPEERKISAGVTSNVAQRIHTSLGHSSSFDLGMTHPGSLATWRLSSERARRTEDGRQDMAPAVSSYRSGTDHVAMTISGGGGQTLPSLAENQTQTSTVGVVEDVASKTRQEIEDFHRNQRQQQQEKADVPLQQSRRRSEVLASSAWYQSSRRARRRWSEMVVVPETPPCSPATPDWFNPRHLTGSTSPPDWSNPRHQTGSTLVTRLAQPSSPDWFNPRHLTGPTLVVRLVQPYHQTGSTLVTRLVQPRHLTGSTLVARLVQPSSSD